MKAPMSMTRSAAPRPGSALRPRRAGRRDRGGLGIVFGLVFAAVMAGFAVDAPARADGKVAGQVDSIRAVEGAAGVTTLEIGVSQRPTFTTWKLDQPARVVLDLSGVRLGAVTAPFEAGTFAVGTVYANVSEGEGGPRTRIVVSLRRAADYDVAADAGRVLLSVRPHDQPKPAVAAAPAVNGLEQAKEAAHHAETEVKLAAAEGRREAAERRRQEAERSLAESKLATEKARNELAQSGRALADAEATARRAQAQLSAQQGQAEATLAAAKRVVAEGEAKLARTAADLERREQAAQAAAARLTALAAASNVSAKTRAEANAALAKATRDREAAGLAAAQSESALARAVADRRSAEEGLARIARDRAVEEQRLAAATARRTAEEARLAEVQAGRSTLESDRARLLAEKQALEGEVARLRGEAARAQASKAATPPAAAVAMAKPVAAPALPPLVVAAKPVAAPAPAAPAAPPAAPALARASIVAMPAPAAPPRPRSITIRAPSRVQGIDFIDEPTRSSVVVALDEPSQYTIERGAGGRVTLRLLRTDLPAGLERSLDATEFLGPVRIISSYRDPAMRGAVRIDVDMAEDVPNDVRIESAATEDRPLGTRLVWDFRKGPTSSLGAGAFHEMVSLPRRIAGYSSERWLAPMVVAQVLSPQQQAQAQAQAQMQAQRAPSGGKKRFTGRRIDLDFKGADIHNIVRLLADVGGVNIVTSDDVKGEVTIKMRDVPWDQALDVVLRQKQLGQVREGNLVRVAPLAVLEKELEQEIARQKQITEVLPTETRLIGVSYAEAKLLTDRVKDLLSPRGKISVDERTNTLIVSDVSRNLALVEELVRNLDTQTSQVVIEARIVEARSTFVRQIGVQWGGTGFADTAHGNPTGLVFPNSIGVGGGATDGKTPLEGLGAANPNFAVNLPAAVGTGSGGAVGITLGSVAGAFNLNLRLSAMESTGQVRILSSPRISTLDNTEATISQGVSIPISVVSAQGVQTVFVDAKLNLTVKPHVTNEGTVMMEVKVERNEPDFVNTGARGDPTILKKEANTKMLVRDGDTAVIGGIYQRNSGLSYAKVPFFADLPVLGALFRARRENDDRTEFLVFITPRIANRARSLGQ
jgi:type IV pilus assembly protein PilQ